jgi:two-component system, sensor histidine kinase and response regulator
MLTGLKILLVEDDEDDYLITRDLFEDLHPGQVELEWVTTVKEAIQALTENRHDLCLVDYRLGAEDGLQLLRTASDSGITTPCIMLTGQHDSRVDADAQKAGAVDYLVKSELNAAILARTVRYARARRDAEDERAQRLRAEAENKLKSQFLANLSHELRTPLTSILGFSELLLSRESNLDKIQGLRTIDRNGRHLLSLLNDVLDLSKIEAGKLDLDLCAVNPQSVLADLQSLLEHQAREKGIEIAFTAPALVPETIQTDPTRLRQILLNLLGNAIKFTQKGRVEISVSTEQVAKERGDVIHFQISDTGSGISTADLGRVFEPFVQSDNAPRGVGFGLGLSISSDLAKKLGGALTCRSELGSGSTFTLSLPAGDLRDVPFRALELVKRVDLPSTRTFFQMQGTVLVVDDLVDIRNLLGQILEERGIAVVFAENGQQAVNKVLGNNSSCPPIDAVVMDLQMPVLDGFAALQALRNGGFAGPVIALTASAMRGERERCLRAGFTEYLGKPVDVDHLLQCLSNYLETTGGSAAMQPVRRVSGSATDKASRGTVLLVEDDDDARRTLSKLIAHLGWDVLDARSAEDALLSVAEYSGSIDIALIDLGLPQQDGFQLASQLREDALADKRIFALSGSQPDPERTRCAGFDLHVQKPISLDELERILQV